MPETYPIEFKLLKTMDPNEWAFRIFVREDRFLDGSTNFPKVGVTTYDQLFGGYPPRQIAFGNYVFTQTINAPEGFIGFCFGMPKIDTNGNDLSLIPFRTTTNFKPHNWHNILKFLTFLRDPNFPVTTTGPQGQTILAPRNLPREGFVPGGAYGSLFTLNEYQSPTPFTITPHEIPVAGHVSYRWHDVEGSIPECLHPEIVIKSQKSATLQYNATTGETSAAASGNKGQYFPATNFEGWDTYTVEDDQEQTESGLWYRRELIVTPPDEPESSIII